MSTRGDRKEMMWPKGAQEVEYVGLDGYMIERSEGRKKFPKSFKTSTVEVRIKFQRDYQKLKIILMKHFYSYLKL